MDKSLLRRVESFLNDFLALTGPDMDDQWKQIVLRPMQKKAEALIGEVQHASKP